MKPTRTRVFYTSHGDRWDLNAYLQPDTGNGHWVTWQAKNTAGHLHTEHWPVDPGAGWWAPRVLLQSLEAISANEEVAR